MCGEHLEMAMHFQLSAHCWVCGKLTTVACHEVCKRIDKVLGVRDDDNARRILKPAQNTTMKCNYYFLRGYQLLRQSAWQPTR